MGYVSRFTLAVAWRVESCGSYSHSTRGHVIRRMQPPNSPQRGKTKVKNSFQANEGERISKSLCLANTVALGPLSPESFLKITGAPVISRRTFQECRHRTPIRGPKISRLGSSPSLMIETQGTQGEYLFVNRLKMALHKIVVEPVNDSP